MKEEISIVSNLWIRQIELGKGEKVAGHSHTFDHQHLLSVGKVRVSIDGKKSRVFEAPSVIFVERNKMHEIEALSDNTLGYCIHPIRDGYRVEDIVSPAMTVTFADFASDNFTPLLNEEDNSEDADLTPAKPWEGCHSNDLEPGAYNKE